MLQVIGATIRFINSDFFVARTRHGHWVIFASQPASTDKISICIVLNNGACMKRVLYCQGERGHKVDVILADIAAEMGMALSADGFSEREWNGAEEAASSDVFKPPLPAFRVVEQQVMT